MVFFIWKKGLFLLKKWKKGCYLHLHQEQELTGEDASDRGAVAQPSSKVKTSSIPRQASHPSARCTFLARARRIGACVPSRITIWYGIRPSPVLQAGGRDISS
jgi:hypothetical protein